MKAVRHVTIAKGIDLYCGDCRDVLPLLGQIDAVVSDPPYGMRWDANSKRFSGGNRLRGEGRAWNNIHGDDEAFDPGPWIQFPEAILWGANHFAQRLPVGSLLVWIKKHPTAFGTFLSDAEVAWHSNGHGVYCRIIEFPNGARVLEADDANAAHPTQKLIALMEWCISRLKDDRRTILDPFMGSGTTGIAAMRQGRRFVGVEIDEAYFETACRRMSKALAQRDLFRADLS